MTRMPRAHGHPVERQERPLLTVEGIAVRYRNGALGVLDVSLEVGAGEVVAMIGGNGAGKTTTVRAISGFLRSEGAKIQSGDVHFDGHRITNWEPHAAARLGVAVVPERQKIFPSLTVHENLFAMATTPKRERCEELLQQIDGMFPALLSRRVQLAGTLSGGQQQMLALARAIMMQPRLLLVDEMTLGLHPSVHATLYAAVEAIAANGTSVLVVDENWAFALRVAHRCYFLASGLIVKHGPTTEFCEELMQAAAVGASRRDTAR